MPIVFNIDLVMVKRKISSNELARRIGINAGSLSVLKTGKARAIKMSTLEALCRELECQPGDILEYTARPANDGHGNNPPADEEPL
jgi:putative transcriptional regulator